MNEPVTFKSAGDAIRITTFGNQMEKIDEENSDKNSSKIDSAFNSNQKPKRITSDHSRSFDEGSYRPSVFDGVSQSRVNPGRSNTYSRIDKSDTTSRLLNPTSSTFKQAKLK